MIKDIRMVEIAPINGMSVRGVVAFENIAKSVGESYGDVIGYMMRNGIQPNGPPFAFYHSYDDRSTDMEAGFPCAEVMEGEGRVKAMTLPGGKVVAAMHIGPYDKLAESYNEMLRWMSENSLKPRTEMWEVYLNSPDEVKDPSQLVTEIYWPYD
ncbi:MAG: GyrI-like domain-containing protein [Methanomassiliicoccales archaeon]|jgi:effector-binding domain-containing protein